MDDKHAEHINVLNVMWHLSICHSVILNVDGEYSASSPDELALVQMAKHFDYCFTGRDVSHNIIKIQTHEGIHDVQIVYEIAFTSSRKCMSVIVEVDQE